MAFPRLGLKGELLPLPEPGEAGVDALCSEVVDWLRPPIGTVRWCAFELVSVAEVGESGRGISSSDGVSSAAGIGRPRAAAII